MNIDGNQIHISVTELSKLGSKHFPFSVPGPSLKRAAMGRQAQSLYQNSVLKTNQTYETEISISRRDIIGNYEIFLGGRIDGRFWQNRKLVIDEIKSVTLSASDFDQLEEQTFTNHRNQLAIYQWLTSLDFPGIQIESRLIYVNLTDEQVRVLPLKMENDQCEKIYLQQSAIIISLIRENIARSQSKRVASEQLRWPFKNRRSSQEEMIRSVEEAHRNNQQLMINAPTGTGKTLGSFYPTIQFALKNNKRIFFLTSKTTQQKIALETVRQIIPQDLGVITIQLRATQKMCTNDHYFCNELVCPYAKDFEEKLSSNQVIDKLLKFEMIEPDTIIKIAKDAVVCPAETMFQLASKADILIGDFNYAFDPVAYLKFIFAEDISNIIPIIDEAHNLYPRIQDTYSPSLSMKEIETLIDYCRGKSGEIFYRLDEWLTDLARQFKELHFTGELEYASQSRYLPDIDYPIWQEKQFELDELFVQYFLYKINKTLLIENDPIDKFYFQFSFFVEILSLKGREFFHIFEASDGGKIQIYCSDPGRVLNSRMGQFSSLIAMSATLKPFEFFTTMIGLDNSRINTIDLPSPFSNENILVFINNKISTRYKDRVRNTLKIADFINASAARKKGNYLIFFPSFEFLELCWPFIHVPGFNKIRQPISSNDAEREELLQKLQEENPALFFVVMGGVFSEGIDYTGDLAIGAFIISPGLPPYDYYNELQRHYFDREYGQGQNYAYLFPGMNKVVQAAGRVIRSENDRGMIFLIGNRFSQQDYQNLFPENWFKNGKVKEGGSFLTDIIKFWSN